MTYRSINFFQWVSIFTVFGLLISCGSTKQITSSEPVYQPLENSLLWKIEGNELNKPSYLYGTIHMIDSEDYFLPSGTLSAIDESDRVVFEIDMNEMSDMGSMMSLMGKAFMSDGQTLRDLLNEDEYKLVEDHFSKMGLPLMMLQRIKPAFLTVFAYDIDPNGMENGSIKSYEMEFFKMANDASKPVAGLETIEFQMGVFDSIPYPDQAKMLVDAIKGGNTDDDQFKVMVDMYKAQNINDMVAMISEDESMGGDNEDILLTGRNKNWIPVMADMMLKDKVFFAVGAGHLAGPNGVINLLRTHGYTLTPVSQVK